MRERQSQTHVPTAFSFMLPVPSLDPVFLKILLMPYHLYNKLLILLFPSGSSSLFPLVMIGEPCMCPQSLRSCPTFCDHMDCSPTGSSVQWNSPGMNTGVGCHPLLQGIFPTQGSNPVSVSPALAGAFFTTSATGRTVANMCSSVSQIRCFIIPGV